MWIDHQEKRNNGGQHGHDGSLIITAKRQLYKLVSSEEEDNLETDQSFFTESMYLL